MTEAVLEKASKLGPVVTLMLAMLGVAVAWGVSQGTLNDMRDSQRQMIAEVRAIAVDVATWKSTAGYNSQNIARLEARLDRIDARR